MTVQWVKPVTIDTLIELGVEEGYDPETAKTVALECLLLEAVAEQEDMSDIDSWM